jgi:phytoene synthase
VIGLQMLPILGTTVPHAIAAPYAADLGVAFQLTNFLRDVGEDLRRGRVYLPQESLRLFGVEEEQLRRGIVDGPVRRLLQFEIARTRELYRSSQPGLRLVEPASRRCLEVAWTLYQGILDEIERADYQILDRRVSVGLGRRLAAVSRSVAQSLVR